MGPDDGYWGQWTKGTWFLAADDTDDRADRLTNTQLHPAVRTPDPACALALELCHFTLNPQMIVGKAPGAAIGPSHLGVISMIGQSGLEQKEK